MGFSFRKAFNIGKLLRINISKSGIGFSAGIPGFRVGIDPKGKVRRTLSIPGTGIRETKVLNPDAPAPRLCPSCGKRVGKSDRFCSKCGSAL